MQSAISQALANTRHAACVAPYDKKLQEACNRRALTFQKMHEHESGIVQCMVALDTINLDIQRLLDERLDAVATLGA